MFLLGGLFVALVVGLIRAVNSPGSRFLIGMVGLGIAWFQWYNSDTSRSRRCAPGWSRHRRRRSCTR